MPTPPAPAVLTTPEGRLVARRFTFGLTPALATDIKRAGGVREWFVSQLAPETISDPAGDQVDSWFDYLGRTPDEIFQRDRNGTEGTGPVMKSLSRRTVLRRLSSKRQVHEVMVDFWSNLLNVPLGSRTAQPARADYDRLIRQYALTSFEQLLQQAITHPAMGVNLNNNVSTKQAPNENLGRELLELHTVGLGYSEADVYGSARILTGYRVDTKKSFRAYYDPASHWTGPLSVLGFHTANASADGQAVTMAYLSYLAHHPMTAQRIARRLCVRFVRDDPSDALVQAVAAAYTLNNTAIQPTLLALLDHPEFAASGGLKLRTPQEDWQAMVRALGITVLRPTRETSFGNLMIYQYRHLGAAPYEWDAPNGYPEVNAAWSSAGRMLTSFGVHTKMAAQQSLRLDVVMPDLVTVVRPTSGTLQGLIDAWALHLYGEGARANTSQAVSEALGLPLDHVMTAKELTRPRIRIVVVTLLDSPQHMYR